jgi:hypothetical protein
MASKTETYNVTAPTDKSDIPLIETNKGEAVVVQVEAEKTDEKDR